LAFWFRTPGSVLGAVNNLLHVTGTARDDDELAPRTLESLLVALLDDLVKTRGVPRGKQFGRAGKLLLQRGRENIDT